MVLFSITSGIRVAEIRVLYVLHQVSVFHGTSGVLVPPKLLLSKLRRRPDNGRWRQWNRDNLLTQHIHISYTRARY